MGVSRDGLMVPAHVPGDLPESGSLREHLVNQCVMSPAALRHRALRVLDGLRGFDGDRGGLLDQAALVLGDQPLDCGGAGGGRRSDHGTFVDARHHSLIRPGSMSASAADRTRRPTASRYAV
jgi:hypothetical protein